MGFECSASNITGILNAHYPPADFRKDIYRISTFEKGKPFGRFLGTGLSDHGRHTTASATVGEGLHQANPHTPGVFTATKQHTLALSATHNETISAEYNSSAFLFKNIV